MWTMLLFHSEDGVKLRTGMDVWVHCKSTNTIELKKIGFVHESGKKIIYDTPDKNGYLGARISIVYVNKDKAEQAVEDYQTIFEEDGV